MTMLSKKLLHTALLSISIITLQSACTSTAKVGAQMPSKIEKIDFKNYTIGKAHSAFVGDPILQRKTYNAVIRKDTYQAQNDFVLQGGVATTVISLQASAGDTFKITGVNEQGNQVVNIPNSIYMFGIDKNGQWDKTVMSPSFWTSPIGSGDQYKLSPLDTRFKIVESITPLASEGYLNHELIFTGLSSNGINFLYREYTFENMAKSAFKQELVYPADSKEIQFKSYQMKISSVTPSKISLTVISE